jgi:hypothetical protein
MPTNANLLAIYVQKPGLGFGREAGLQRADAIDDALEAERPEGAWLH